MHIRPGPRDLSVEGSPAVARGHRRVRRPSAMIGRMDSTAARREVPISTDTIRLGQLLKLAGLADSGSEAKWLLDDVDDDGEPRVRVNGEPETRRGRTIVVGDVVAVDDDEVVVVAG